jgi:hypothetical protein
MYVCTYGVQIYPFLDKRGAATEAYECVRMSCLQALRCVMVSAMPWSKRDPDWLVSLISYLSLVGGTLTGKGGELAAGGCN